MAKSKSSFDAGLKDLGDMWKGGLNDLHEATKAFPDSIGRPVTYSEPTVTEEKQVQEEKPKEKEINI